MTPEYAEFLASKAVRAPERGLTAMPEIGSHLFPFQRRCVEHALRVGAGGVFLDTGLGKTLVQLEWCKHAIEHANGRALLMTPLAVARQIEREGKRFGYHVRVIREQSEAGEGINICNYDRLEKLDPSAFGVVALDEASILKSFTGKTTRALINAFRDHRWKLVATATPAPNDHMELSNYGEFLGVMSSNEMLSRFFINDAATASQEWRLKHHAVIPFWDWMASWSRMAQLPSDLGDSDEGFILPPMNVTRHRAADSKITNELADMFGGVAMSATSLHDIKRQTSVARAEVVAALVRAEPAEAWVLWCDTDYEADAIHKAVPDAVEIRGSQSIDEKEEKLAAFASGEARYLIGKPSMLGFGLNWQHCARVAFVGRSYSYESYYQAVRRCWRFGQKRDVNVHLVLAEGEAEIGRVIDRKADDHDKMRNAMRAAMARADDRVTETKVAYNPTHKGKIPSWLQSAA